MNTDNNESKNQTGFELVNPSWGSSLTRTIIELEHLRVKKLGGPVPPYIFFQLKEIFQLLESLGSARIEGNRTTLAEFVEKVIETPGRKTKDEKIREIFNIERAIAFIEENISEKETLSKAHILEIHKILVQDLTPPPKGEGSKYPGQFRPINVGIKNAKHIPPEALHVSEQMDKLIGFINQDCGPQHDLLITALSHHKMAWIHPFDNGNGRVIRMFTYAMLIKQGFKVKDGRLLNPTAIFCMDRNRYYDMLELADTGEKNNVLSWCEYVLNGLKVELEKIDKLLDRKYLVAKILLPALRISLESENITNREYEILRGLINNEDMEIKSADIEKILNEKSAVQRSRIISRLKDKKMLMSLKKDGRIYTIKFSNNYLLRAIISMLEKERFIPESLNQN